MHLSLLFQPSFLSDTVFYHLHSLHNKIKPKNSDHSLKIKTKYHMFITISTAHILLQDALLSRSLTQIILVPIMIVLTGDAQHHIKYFVEITASAEMLRSLFGSGTLQKSDLFDYYFEHFLPFLFLTQTFKRIPPS